jgi:hypothetical protein
MKLASDGQPAPQQRTAATNFRSTDEKVIFDECSYALLDKYNCDAPFLRYAVHAARPKTPLEQCLSQDSTFGPIGYGFTITACGRRKIRMKPRQLHIRRTGPDPFHVERFDERVVRFCICETQDLDEAARIYDACAIFIFEWSRCKYSLNFHPLTTDDVVLPEKLMDTLRLLRAHREGTLEIISSHREGTLKIISFPSPELRAHREGTREVISFPSPEGRKEQFRENWLALLPADLPSRLWISRH